MARAPKSNQTKSDFILGHPDIQAKEIVAKGKAVGLEFNEKYVYTIRSVARSRKQRDEARAAVGPGSSGANTGAGALLVAVAAEVGLGRAIGLLEQERKRVLTAMGR